MRNKDPYVVTSWAPKGERGMFVFVCAASFERFADSGQIEKFRFPYYAFPLCKCLTIYLFDVLNLFAHFWRTRWMW